MGYTLEAFIAKQTPLEMLKSKFQNGIIVPLPQSFGLIELSRLKMELYGSYEIPPSERIKDLGGLSRQLDAAAREVSHAGPIAYVESHLFAGVGPSACIIWEYGDISFGPYAIDTEFDKVKLRKQPINRALQKLGVERGDHYDEFDALGLVLIETPINGLNEAWSQIVLRLTKPHPLPPPHARGGEVLSTGL